MTTIPKQDQLTNIPWSEISVQRDLGEGNFGTVSLGVWKGVQVALKRCKDPNNTEFLQEAQLMMYVKNQCTSVANFWTCQIYSSPPERCEIFWHVTGRCINGPRDGILQRPQSRHETVRHARDSHQQREATTVNWHRSRS